MNIILQTNDGSHYICAENGGGTTITANRANAHEWETFEVIDSLNYGGRISLRTNDGIHYLCAENGGGSILAANRTDASEWETFRIIGPNGKADGTPVQNTDKIALQTYDGSHYISAENGGGANLAANSEDAHEWETFTVYITQTEVSLPTISLKTYDGLHYLCAENGGGTTLVANRADAHEWETLEVDGPLVYGGSISLRTYDGIHYLCAENGGGTTLAADRTDAREWETFRIIGPNGKADGTSVQNGDKISLQTYDGTHYMCAENGGGTTLIADRTSPGEWETFTVSLSGTVMRHLEITFQTNDGTHYLCAENGGGTTLVADRTSAGVWETFTVVGSLVYGGKISFRTYDGLHFLSAESGGGMTLTAGRKDVREWETFRIIGPNGKADGTPVQTGDKISLQTYDGSHYVSAENGGGTTLIADRTDAREWETFTIRLKYTSAILPALRIIHISDTHCTSSDRTLDFVNGQLVEDYQNSEIKTNDIANFLINNKANLGTKTIVLTGDLTDSGDDQDFTHEKRGVLQFIQKLTAAGFEIFSVPGNHDYNFEGNKFSTTDAESRRNRFILHITPQYAIQPKYPHIEDITDSTGIKTGRIILLDSMQEELDGNTDNSLAQGTLGDKQLYGDGKIKGLKAAVEEYQNDRKNGKKLIVALHHSPFSTGEDGWLSDRDKFLDILYDKSKNVSLVDSLLFGHTTPPNVYQEDFPTEENQLRMPVNSINCENLEKMNTTYPVTVLDLTRHQKKVFYTDTSTWEPVSDCTAHTSGCAAEACGEKIGACLPVTCEAQAVGCAAEACGGKVNGCVSDGCAAQANGCAAHACAADADICAAQGCAGNAGCGIDACPANLGVYAAQGCAGKACAVDVSAPCAADGQVGPCAVDIPYCPFVL